MHVFLANFHQGVKTTAQIASHQAQLRRKGKFTGQNYLSITSLHTEYLNLDSISGSGRNNQRANIVQTKCTFCEDSNHSAENILKE